MSHYLWITEKLTVLSLCPVKVYEKSLNFFFGTIDNFVTILRCGGAKELVTEKKSINWKWTAPSGCNLILILDWLPLKLSFPDFRLTLNNETDQRKWILILSGKKKSLGHCQRCWKLDWLGLGQSCEFSWKISLLVANHYRKCR